MKIPNNIPNKANNSDNKPKKQSKKSYLSLIGAISLLLICFVVMIYYFTIYSNDNKQKQTSSASSTTSILKSSSSKKSSSSETKTKTSESSKVENPVVQKLTSQATETKQPYSIAIKDIGGGYTFGIITYYPDDADKTYMDYSITAPDTPSEPTKDDKVTEIENKLKESLPTINKSIEVADATKVSMLTYKQDDDSYHTILLYEGIPFGYVLTDKDGHMTNNVTTYYIQNVKKKDSE